jgi:type II secretory pathway pseudopilin PulG
MPPRAGWDPMILSLKTSAKARQGLLTRPTFFIAIIVLILIVSALATGYAFEVPTSSHRTQVATSTLSVGNSQLAAAQQSLNQSRSASAIHPAIGPEFPPLREYAAMAWDPAAGYVVLFGGSNQSTPSSEGGYPNLDDTWDFSGGAWTRLSPSASPPATSFAAMTYDPNESAIVLFGGEIAGAGGYLQVVNTTWEFHSGTWTNVSTPISPSPRLSPSLSDDPSRDGLVLFGGLQYFPYGTPNGTGTDEVPESDTWTFDGGVWSNITSSVGSPPHGRYLAGMAYDPNESGDVLFGGWEDLSDSTPTFNDTWVLGPTGWANVTPSFGPPLSGGMALAFLSETDSIILYGGWIPSVGAEYNSTWSFAAGIWTKLSPATVPPNTFAGGFADDPTDGYGVLLLGQMNTGYTLSEETWTFAHGNWSLAGANSSLPPAGAATMVYDPSEQEVVLIPNLGTGFASGSTATWVYSDGNWTKLTTTIAPGTLLVYDGADGYVLGYESTGSNTSTWKFENNSWTELFPATSPPRGEWGDIVYDARDGYVLFYTDYDSSTWKWSDGDWSNLNLTTAPRLAYTLAINTMTYDAADGYVLLVQGSNFSCGPGGDCLLTWAYSNGVWTDLTGKSTQTPPDLMDESITYDDADGKVLLFGGRYYSSNGSTSNQTWAFQGGQWTSLAPSTVPTARYYAGLSYDPAISQVLMFGGEGTVPYGGGATYYPLADTWEFVNDTWTELIPRLAAAYSSTDIGVPTSLTTLPLGVFGSAAFSYSGLPAGCESADSASITCVPTAAGSYHVTVSVEAATGQASASTELSVANLPKISGFDASANPTQTNSSTTLSVTVTGGTPPFSYTYRGLPPGCTSANLSTLACTPTGDGKYTISLEVTDMFDKSDNATLGLTVGFTNGGVNLATLLAWITSPLGVVLLGILVVAASVSSVMVVRTRRTRAEGERLVEGMRRAVSEAPEFGKPPP